MVAGRHPGRRVDVVGDSAFACKATGSLGDAVTLTSRLRANAVIYAPKPPPTGKHGRPRVTGQRLGNCAQIAAAASRLDWQRVDVPGRDEATVLVTDGLWYSVFGARAVRVVIVRHNADSEGYEIALITADLDASPAQIIARLAALVDRSLLPRRQTRRRRRTGPQPRQARRRADRAVRASLPEHHDRVVRAARRPRRPPATFAPAPARTVVPKQTRPIDARYPSLDAPRADPQRISRTSRPQAHTRANQPALDATDHRDWLDHESRASSPPKKNIALSGGLAGFHVDGDATADIASCSGQREARGEGRPDPAGPESGPDGFGGCSRGRCALVVR